MEGFEQRSVCHHFYEFTLTSENKLREAKTEGKLIRKLY